jgi:hypothetical protein
VTVDVGEGSVDVVTLDELDIPRVNLVKIDVEGHEEDVIQGGAETLRRWRPYVIAEGRVNSLLSEFGYIRIPLSFATTPTYLYAPTWGRAFQALITPPIPAIAARRTARTAADATIRAVKRFIR